MEAIQLNGTNIAEAAKRAADVLRLGGVILYPTDTLYGLGADAFSDEAVAKVYAIKGREEGKPMHAVFADTTMAGKYAEVNDIGQKLAEKFLPGALTLVLKKLPGIDNGIARDMSTIGIRIPDDQFCLELARNFGPFTATSANKSGAPSARRADEILTQLGESASRIDLVIDAGEIPARAATTVVDVSAGSIRIIREGAIPSSEILAV
jgi:L-threonylcarbamoyladenylate synthase